MKTRIKFKTGIAILFGIFMGMVSCKEHKTEPTSEIALDSSPAKKKQQKNLSKEFKDYWYNGTAEISSYSLEQARYGEIRKGTSVLIYVTEPFVADKQVKADQFADSNLPVLKLNSTKKYFTGIYPYSIMSSSFYSVHDHQHAIKLTFSAQEWCGQVYAQLNNRETFDISSFSYFESEGDQQLQLEKNVLENELWNRIRINPKDLPQGELAVIPSLEYIRLSHKQLKAYKAVASLAHKEGLYTYSLHYPKLERSLEIHFNMAFPYEVQGWQETFKSGFGASAKTLVSTATKIKTINTPYWQQNSNKHSSLRDTLGL